VFRWGKLRQQNIVARHVAAVNELAKRLPLDAVHVIAPPPVGRAGKPLTLQAPKPPKPVVQMFDEGDVLYMREPSGAPLFFRVVGHTVKGTPSLKELHYGGQHRRGLTPAGAPQLTHNIRIFKPQKMWVGLRAKYDPAMVKWNP